MQYNRSAAALPREWMVSELKTESAVMRTSSPLQRMIQQLTPPSSPPQSLTILEDFLPSLAKTNLDKKKCSLLLNSSRPEQGFFGWSLTFLIVYSSKNCNKAFEATTTTNMFQLLGRAGAFFKSPDLEPVKKVQLFHADLFKF